MQDDDANGLRVDRLTAGGRLIVWSVRARATGAGTDGQLCGAFAAAGLTEALADGAAFLAIVTASAPGAFTAGAIERCRLDDGEVALVDALSALQRGRRRLAHSILEGSVPAHAVGMAIAPGQRLARAMARRGLTIGFRTGRAPGAATAVPCGVAELGLAVG